MSEPPTKKRITFGRIAIGCAGLIILAVIVLGVAAFFFRTPVEVITYDTFTQAVSEGRVKPDSSGAIRVTLVTEEGARARPPSIMGYYYHSQQDHASQSAHRFRAELPTETAQAGFQSFSASHAIQVEKTKEGNLLPF